MNQLGSFLEFLASSGMVFVSSIYLIRYLRPPENGQIGWLHGSVLIIGLALLILVLAGVCWKELGQAKLRTKCTVISLTAAGAIISFSMFEMEVGSRLIQIGAYVAPQLLIPIAIFVFKR